MAVEQERYEQVTMSVNAELARQLDAIAAKRAVGRGAVAVAALRSFVQDYEIRGWPQPGQQEPWGHAGDGERR